MSCDVCSGPIESERAKLALKRCHGCAQFYDTESVAVQCGTVNRPTAKARKMRASMAAKIATPTKPDEKPAGRFTMNLFGTRFFDDYEGAVEYGESVNTEPQKVQGEKTQYVVVLRRQRGFDDLTEAITYAGTMHDIDPDISTTVRDSVPATQGGLGQVWPITDRWAKQGTERTRRY